MKKDIFKVKNIKPLLDSIIFADENTKTVSYSDVVDALCENPALFQTLKDEDFCKDEYVAFETVMKKPQAKRSSEAFMHSIPLQFLVWKIELDAFETGKDVIKKIMIENYNAEKGQRLFVKSKLKKMQKHLLKSWEKVFTLCGMNFTKNLVLYCSLNDERMTFINSNGFPSSPEKDEELFNEVIKADNGDLSPYEFYRRIEKEDEDALERDYSKNLLEETLVPYLSECFQTNATIEDVFKIANMSVEVPKGWEKSK